MKNWKILTIIGLALVASTLLVSTVAAMPWGVGGGMMGGWGRGGMMSGYGYNPAYPNQQGLSGSNNQYYQPVYPFQFGGSCHGRFGWNNGYGATAPYTNNGSPIAIATAKTIIQNYLTSTGNPDLTAKEIEEYHANFYVQVSEKSTGNGAFELLINKYTGSIYPEMGPNMMWNTKYGMMRGGALSGIFGAPTTTMTITATRATTNAQEFLTTSLAGTTAGDVTTFYGYYTIEILKDGSHFGMLSVNGFTGQIWVHNWHGVFIQELGI
jgi:hypothetical protein